jgi:hypothetical protein
VKITGRLYGNQYIRGYIIPRGNDGFSPIITVSSIAGGNRITIQDIQGEKVFDVLNGVAGPAGPQGEPYVLTDKDKATIKAYIDESLGVVENGTY